MTEHHWQDFENKSLEEAVKAHAGPLWLLAGEESWMRRDFLDRLVRCLLSEEERTWGLERFQLSLALLRTSPPEGTWAKSILGAVTTLPFFASRRVVAVEEFQLLPAAEQEELANSLENIPATSVLILSTSESGGKGRPGGKTAASQSRLSAALWQAAKERGRLVKFDSLKPEEAIRWVQERARRSGKRLESSAAALLVQQRLGTDLGKLQAEIDKLLLFAGSAPSIRSADVEAMTPRVLEEKIYDLANAGMQKSGGRARALILLRALLKGKGDEEPKKILPVLTNHFRRLWQIKAMLEKGWRPGQSHQDLSEIEGVILSGRDSANTLFSSKMNWLLPKLAEQARRYTWPQMEKAMLTLFRCDLALKGMSDPPRSDPGLALELAIIALFMEPAELSATGGSRRP